jgi:acyl-homoserine-lactone acylase
LTPALRVIIDFGQPEPMMGQNSAGESGNPASPHYADGIDPWLKGQYTTIPMQPQNLERAYGKERLTLTPGR